jgi:glycerol kinase
MQVLLALDQGTTSSRSVLFDLEGNPLGSAQREFPQHFPRPGWVEHDPADLWESQIGTVRDVLAKTGTAPRDVVAVGITNQRETTLIWEKSTGKPIHNAIVWQDRRTADLCELLRRRGLAELVARKTGLLLDPYFSATKIAWILDNVEGAARRAKAGELAFGTVDSWLVYNLTGGAAHLTDVTNAARTSLFDVHALRWDDELLDAFGIPRSLLPEVRPSAGAFAPTHPQIFGAAVPITGVAGDQHAALFGQGCLRPGMAKNTYGTGAFVMMNTGATCFRSDGAIATVAWQIGGEPARYALEGSIFIAGAAVQWLRDGLGIIASTGAVQELASSVPDSGGVYFVPALAGLGAPHWDPDARGLLIGITRGTTKAHVARAALEAMAFQTKDAIAAMERASGLTLAELRVDGGASANDLLMQFQADVLGVPVLRPALAESTALGVAYLAGIGSGVLDVATVEKRLRAERRFEPAPDARTAAYGQWQRAVSRSLKWRQIESGGTLEGG